VAGGDVIIEVSNGGNEIGAGNFSFLAYHFLEDEEGFSERTTIQISNGKLHINEDFISFGWTFDLEFVVDGNGLISLEGNVESKNETIILIVFKPEESKMFHLYYPLIFNSSDGIELNRKEENETITYETNISNLSLVTSYEGDGVGIIVQENLTPLLEVSSSLSNMTSSGKLITGLLEKNTTCEQSAVGPESTCLMPQIQNFPLTSLHMPFLHIVADLIEDPLSNAFILVADIENESMVMNMKRTYNSLNIVMHACQKINFLQKCIIKNDTYYV